MTVCQACLNLVSQRHEQRSMQSGSNHLGSLQLHEAHDLHTRWEKTSSAGGGCGVNGLRETYYDLPWEGRVEDPTWPQLVYLDPAFRKHKLAQQQVRHSS